MIAVKYAGATYVVELTPSGKIIVQALFRVAHHVDIKQDELAAHLWLGNHGLRRGYIKRLLDAAVRNEGDFADPAHPRRVDQTWTSDGP